MLAARGEALLMMDADGATQVRDLERLEAALAGAAKKGATPWVLALNPNLKISAPSSRRWRPGGQAAPTRQVSGSKCARALSGGPCQLQRRAGDVRELRTGCTGLVLKCPVSTGSKAGVGSRKAL